MHKHAGVHTRARAHTHTHTFYNMHLKIMVLGCGGWEQRKFHHLKAHVTKI